MKPGGNAQGLPFHPGVTGNGEDQGHIRAAGVDKDVSFVVDTDPGLNDRIDSEYRSKYRRYSASIVGGVVNPASRASTIKLVPR